MQEDTTQPNADGSGNAGAPTEEKRFTQAELEAAITARLTRERSTAKAKADAEREAQEAERLKVQGEWQTLAQTHEARAKELETQHTSVTAQLESYEKALTRRIKAETKTWPDAAQKALPDTDDPLALEAAVEKLRPLADQLAGQAPPLRQQGSSPGPRPTGGPAKTAVEQELERLRRSGKYARG